MHDWIVKSLEAQIYAVHGCLPQGGGSVAGVGSFHFFHFNASYVLS